MRNFILSISLLTVCAQFIQSQITYEYSDNFIATCDFDGIHDLAEIKIVIEDDSLIIYTNFENQCCPDFTLRVSDITEDTVYIQFADTVTHTVCDCVCRYYLRINAGKKSTHEKTVNYNGRYFTILPGNYQSLLQTDKVWSSVQNYLTGSTNEEVFFEYSINNQTPQPFCWNGIFYYKVTPEVISYGGTINSNDTIPKYLREVNGKIYLMDTTHEKNSGCDEALLYDFTVNIDDTVALGYDSIMYRVVSNDIPTGTNVKHISLADISHPELSNLATWIEGIGDLRGLYKSAETLVLDGSWSVLTCCRNSEGYLYQNQEYANCGREVFFKNRKDRPVSVYPNPANNLLNLSNITNLQKINIYSISGCLQKSIINPDTEINIIDLNPGIYLIQLQSDTKTETIKFIKQK